MKKQQEKKRPVFLIVQHLRPGGIEVLALNLLEKLRGERELHIIALEGTRAAAMAHWPVLQACPDRLHFVNKGAGLSPMAMVKLIGLFLRYRPQAVHTHHIGPMIYGGMAARLCGIRTLIHTEHDGWHLRRNGGLQAKIMRFLRPMMIAVAGHVGHCVARECKTMTPRTIYNGIDTHVFSPGNKTMARLYFGLPKKVRIIGCAGRMEEVKGQRYLIEALQYLPQDVHIALAGDGSLRQDLESHARDLGVGARIHFLGRVDAMNRFYRAVDVFCLPSLNEGFPLSPLEAQACGIPAVLSDVGGCAEALCPRTGTLTKAGDAEDLADKLQQTLNADQTQSQSPRDFILDHFDLDAIAAAYDAVYTNNTNAGGLSYV